MVDVVSSIPTRGNFNFDETLKPYFEFCTKMPEMLEMCYLGKTRTSGHTKSINVLWVWFPLEANLFFCWLWNLPWSQFCTKKVRFVLFRKNSVMEISCRFEIPRWIASFSMFCVWRKQITSRQPARLIKQVISAKTYEGFFVKCVKLFWNKNIRPQIIGLTR